MNPCFPTSTSGVGTMIVCTESALRPRYPRCPLNNRKKAADADMRRDWWFFENKRKSMCSLEDEVFFADRDSECDFIVVL
jgi:hypothetical protein